MGAEGLGGVDHMGEAVVPAELHMAGGKRLAVGADQAAGFGQIERTVGGGFEIADFNILIEPGQGHGRKFAGA